MIIVMKKNKAGKEDKNICVSMVGRALHLNGQGKVALRRQLLSKDLKRGGTETYRYLGIPRNMNTSARALGQVYSYCV